MLFLDDDMIFAHGGRRVCYIHPEDPNKCVKVLGAEGDPRRRRSLAPWYKRLRPLRMFDDNLREYRAFKVLESHGEEVWSFFPRCYGLDVTSLGLGITTDLVRNQDGTVPLTLREYLVTHGFSESVGSALSVFLDFIKRERVVTRDLLDHNLIVRESASGLQIFMIDGFGSSEVIPFSSWFGFLGDRKINRKIFRFKKRYGLLLDPE